MENQCFIKLCNLSEVLFLYKCNQKSVVIKLKIIYSIVLNIDFEGHITYFLEFIFTILNF